MRLFIGIFLPREVLDYLYEVQNNLKKSLPAKITWVHKKILHLSLKFLGEVNENKIDEIKEKLNKIKFKPFKVKLDKIGVFPNENYIKVIWVDLNPKGKVIELQQKIDSELLKLMPQKLVAISGFDALAQALESFTSKNSNLISDYFALQSLDIIISNFEKSWENSENTKARENMALGSFLSGFAIGITDTNLAHAMSHPISAHYGIPHGLAVLLCTFQAIQFNKSVASNKYREVASLFKQEKKHENSVEFLINKLYDWTKKFEINLDFDSYKISKLALEKFVSDALEIGGINTNPRSINEDQLTELYEKAWNGKID